MQPFYLKSELSLHTVVIANQPSIAEQATAGCGGFPKLGYVLWAIIKGSFSGSLYPGKLPRAPG